MKGKRIQLFHNKYRQIHYVSETKTLMVHWFGTISEEEQLRHFDCVKELVKIYEIHHVEVFVRKARFLSLRPTRIFIETVLKQLYQKGAQSFTVFQRPISNEDFVRNAYKNAIDALGIKMEMKIISV